MENNIRQQWMLAHPPELVWECLTKPDLLAQWLMPNDFKAEVGHKFRFNTKPIVKVGFDGIVYCEVLEIVPLKRLVYSWKGGPGKGKITLDSIVSWTLKKNDAGTELLLEHTGFSGFRNLLPYVFMNKGWSNHIRRRFVEVLNNYSHETSGH